VLFTFFSLHVLRFSDYSSQERKSDSRSNLHNKKSYAGPTDSAQRYSFALKMWDRWTPVCAIIGVSHCDALRYISSWISRYSNFEVVRYGTASHVLDLTHALVAMH
jgi:hypothetical protein